MEIYIVFKSFFLDEKKMATHHFKT